MQKDDRPEPVDAAHWSAKAEEFKARADAAKAAGNAELAHMREYAEQGMSALANHHHTARDAHFRIADDIYADVAKFIALAQAAGPNDARKIGKHPALGAPYGEQS